MRNRFASFATAALVAALAACSSAPTETAEKQSTAKEALAREVREELQIGREMSAKILGYYGVEKNNLAKTQYVQLVGNSLASLYGRPELNYRFAILNSPTINAYAVPGGYIFVTRGLLQKLQNESELAAVLAHEIVHVNQRHMYQQIRPKRDVSASESMVRMMSRGASDIGNNLFQIVQQGMKLLLEEGLGKEKELEADSMGVVLTAAAGYDPNAYTRFLERCEKDEKNLKVEGASVGFEERLAMVRKTVAENGLTAQASTMSTTLAKRFAAAIGRTP
jgi:beta-barrel assembly-enhancing protease